MFYMVVRIFRTAQDNNSIQYFNVADYESQDACLRAAEARFHNIITADLQNPDVVYQMTYIHYIKKMREKCRIPGDIFSRRQR